MKIKFLLFIFLFLVTIPSCKEVEKDNDTDRIYNIDKLSVIEKLEHIGAEQVEATDLILQNINKIIGLTYEDLDPKERKVVEQFISKQESIHERIKDIEGEVSQFLIEEDNQELSILMNQLKELNLISDIEDIIKTVKKGNYSNTIDRAYNFIKTLKTIDGIKLE